VDFWKKSVGKGGNDNTGDNAWCLKPFPYLINLLGTVALRFACRRLCFRVLLF